MTIESTILIVEDEKKIACLLSEYFKAGGFHTAILNRGDLVVPFVRNSPPDLIILDLMLPGNNGLQVCKKVREHYSIPIIMLTSRIDEHDVLIGLEAGADDYIRKPFSPKEVVARARTVLRRTGGCRPSPNIRVGPVCLDSQSKVLHIRHRTLPLTPIELSIIKALMLNPGTVISRKDFVENVQGYKCDGYHRTIDTHIKNLRKKIGKVLPEKKVIVSVYGAGYKFNPEITELSSALQKP